MLEKERKKNQTLFEEVKNCQREIKLLVSDKQSAED